MESQNGQAFQRFQTATIPETQTRAHTSRSEDACKKETLPLTDGLNIIHTQFFEIWNECERVMCIIQVTHFWASQDDKERYNASWREP